MAPPSGAGKRVKGCQIFRPFIYGTTARPFDDKTNPKPAGVPDDHTHSWTVFVRGVEDTDITYWLRRVQFKLHESIPNHVRMVEADPGGGAAFEVHETGWGEFEIAIKLYYAGESGEKPQTLYHHLRLHPYGRTEEEKEEMRARPGGEVISWTYEEQVFNEPYEAFYEVLTSGALPPSSASGAATLAGGSRGKGKSATASSSASQPGKRTEGGVLERSAMIPLHSREGHPFSRDTEQLEIEKLRKAQAQVEEMTKKMAADLKCKEEKLAALKKEAEAAVAG